MCAHPYSGGRRIGFTLVELLVAIAIIVFLGAIVIAFLPSLNSQTNEANAAVSLQGYLSIARQKAIRNQSPYGVRVWVNSTNVAPASNNQILPQTVINVASTAGFLPEGGTLTIFLNPTTVTYVTYTGTTGTQFVGCAGGVGTLGTGQQIVQSTEASYIEQPDDFTGGTLYTDSDGAMYVYILGVDVTGGFGATSLYPVQSGDYLEVFGNGLMHSIAFPSVANPNPIQYDSVSNTSKVFLNTPIPYRIDLGAYQPAPPAPYAQNYRILRAPRAVSDDKLSMPSEIIIDLGTNVVFGNTLPPLTEGGTALDILFSPSGSLLTQGVTTNYLALWVRLPEQGDPTNNSASNVFAGSPTLIVVYRDTGFVAAYPPVPGAFPYQDIR